ncbi:MAG TPA: hypothetical protein VHS96_08530 [Bacteroidia bacterium]|nr:hypothetical protein [Bacteroidia bacterium]
MKETLLMEGSANTQQEVILGYNGMAIIREEMAYYHTNNAGITSSILKQVHYNSYDAQSRRSHRVGYLLSDTGQKYLDSTAYTRDAQGRLIHEILRNNPRYSKEVYEKRYTYTSDKIAISSFMNQFVLNRDEYILDEQGRMVQEINYAPDEKPRLQTNYTYDTAGRLIRLDYLPDWDYFQPAETVVSRKNTYDSRGKLVEAKLEYGDGKYMLELYDYTLMSEE